MAGIYSVLAFAFISVDLVHSQSMFSSCFPTIIFPCLGRHRTTAWSRWLERLRVLCLFIGSCCMELCIYHGCLEKVSYAVGHVWMTFFILGHPIFWQNLAPNKCHHPIGCTFDKEGIRSGGNRTYLQFLLGLEKLSPPPPTLVLGFA